MKKFFILFVLLISTGVYAQDELTDWKELDSKTSLVSYIQDQVYSYLDFELTKSTKEANPDSTILADSVILNNYSPGPTKITMRHVSSIPSPERPLIVMNGYPVDLSQIPVSWSLEIVKEVSIIRGNAMARAIYGRFGELGVILITIKKRELKKLDLG